MSFNGRWSWKDASGLAAYYDAIKSPEEHKEKIRSLAEAAKSDPNAYIEELTVTETTFHRVVYFQGEKKRDSGVQQFGAEVADAKSGDGRPAKVKVVRDSATKITRTEDGDGFKTVTTMEVVGDEIKVTHSGNGAQATAVYKRM